LGNDHWLRQSVTESVLTATDGLRKMRDVRTAMEMLERNPHLSQSRILDINMGDGSVTAELSMSQELYYQVIGEMTGIEIGDEAELLRTLQELAQIRTEYEKYSVALDDVTDRGYGIVMPSMDDLRLEDPVVCKQSGGYGIKLRAKAPSIHLIQTTIETEINPIVGTEEQSEEMARHLSEAFSEDPKKLWETNLFGKSLYELMSDGLRTKIAHVSDEAQERLSETLSRVINEGSGGLLCIIL